MIINQINILDVPPFKAKGSLPLDAWSIVLCYTNMVNPL